MFNQQLLPVEAKRDVAYIAANAHSIARNVSTYMFALHISISELTVLVGTEEGVFEVTATVGSETGLGVYLSNSAKRGQLAEAKRKITEVFKHETVAAGFAAHEIKKAA